MRLTVKAGVLLCALSLATMAKPAHAMPIGALLATKPLETTNSQPAEAAVQPTEAPMAASAELAKPIEHKVLTGESLAKIADAYQTTWGRLFDKNAGIVDPNIIHVDDVIIIPLADEQLAPREVVHTEPPVTAVQAQQPAATPKHTVVQASTQSAVYSAPRGGSAGNTYAYGYCTWYAKSRRPDLPNNLGNADTWVTRASAQGLSTGSAPRAGAVGQQGMHVVYVESVNSNGTVTISEMNYKGIGIVSSRTVAASNFRYIY